MPSPTDSSERPWWSRLAVAFCLTYAIGVLGFFALRALLPRWPPFLVLINSFLPFCFAPLLLTLPLTLLIRSKTISITTLAVLSLFVASYGPFFLPRLGPAVASANGTLRVMTFNLQFDHPNPEQAVTVIESETADVVAVQELIPSTARLLRQRLNDRYPYMVLEPEISTTGLLSCYPILHSKWFRMAGDGNVALQAILDVNGRPVHVFAIHPPPPRLSWQISGRLPNGILEDEGDRQVTDLARRAAALEGPILVEGDFNMADQSRAYAEMAVLLKDAYREAGWSFGFTFPHGQRIGRLPLPGPLVRIDYVFHSPDLYAESAHVGCEGGSNHCYLVVRLSFL